MVIRCELGCQGALREGEQHCTVKLRGPSLTALARSLSDILCQYGTEQEMSQTGDGRSGNIQQENNSTLLKCLMDRFEENNFVIRLDFGSIIY